MLVLTRKEGEALIIDGNIKVTVLGVNKFGQYKMGVEAPKNITIDREEIHLKRIQNGEVSGNV